MRESLDKALASSWIVLKLVIPIYILADLLYFYNLLSYVSFLVEPFTSLLGLPPEASLAIISGMFLNLYAAVAFAAPLELSSHQWSVLAVFLGVCHSLIVESAIMKKIGIPHLYSYGLRFFAGLGIAYSTALMPEELFDSVLIAQDFYKAEYASLSELLAGSLWGALILSIKIVILISLLIFIMDFIKRRKFVQKSANNVSKHFSIFAGVLLGITYGAGILIKESNSLSRHDLLYIATFLSICHAIIEDTLLFVIFGADFTMVVLIRTFWALVLSYLFMHIYRYAEENKNR
jgi:uncharacterized membrane protein